jgi:hypothetical protein
MLVREAPPLRLSFEVETPGGARFRWANDARDAVNIPQNVSWSDTMPGGFETLSLTLPRQPGIEYADLDRMSTVRVFGSGGGITGEFRLEKAPRTSGDEVAIAPEAVGWQAHLGDDKSAREIYVDTDLNHWTNPPYQPRHDGLIAGGFNPDYDVGIVYYDAGPVLQIMIRDHWDALKPHPCPQYISHRIPMGSVYYAWSAGGGIVSPGGTPVTTWTWDIRAAPTGWISNGEYDSTGDLAVASEGTGTLFTTTTTGDKIFAELRFLYELAPAGTEAQGLLASDIAVHAVRNWAPMLQTTSESIIPSALPITQACYFDATTAGDIIHDVVRYELLDWAVWENRTFWLTPRNEMGRSWRARIGATQLQETGPQTDRLWNGVMVSYTDWGGETRNVGPPTSGADTETSALLDSDPENPATKLGIRRYEQLSAGKSMTADLAVYLGQRFLQESKTLDRSGQARIVGHVQDEHGVLFPYHAIRAGDTISFTDAADPSPRRIVRTQKSASDYSVTLDLDAPPEGLQAILSRLDLKPNR